VIVIEEVGEKFEGSYCPS